MRSGWTEVLPSDGSPTPEPAERLRVVWVSVVVENERGQRVEPLEHLHVQRGGVVFVRASQKMVGLVAALEAQLAPAGVQVVAVSGEGPGFLEAHAHSGVVVTNLLGHANHVEEWGRRDALVRSAGFRCFTAEEHRDGFGDQLYHLPGAWAAKGPIAGMKLAEIRAWLMREVQPGVIEVVAERWGQGAG